MRLILKAEVQILLNFEGKFDHGNEAGRIMEKESRERLSDAAKQMGVSWRH